MELLILLTYTAIAIFIFKIFQIPLNKWTVPTAALGGLVLVFAMVTLMNYNHPYSDYVRSYYVTTPIVPLVKGRVVRVNVKDNSLIKKGEVLFELEKENYQDKVMAIQARLTAAEKRYQRALALFNKRVASEQEVDNTRSKRDELKAHLEKAQFELDNTIVRAPTDGFVTQLFLRPGMMAVPLPFKPVMVFVHKEQYNYVAWFRQNNLLRLQVGCLAEIGFDAIPGRVFQARIKKILPVMGEGQMLADGRLVQLIAETPAGRVPVVLEVTSPEFSDYQQALPGGSFGQAAVYTHHFHHFAIMRKILLRMSAWLGYIFPFH